MLLIKIMSISRSSPSFIYLSAVNANILVKPNGSKQSWISEQCFLCYVCHFARYWADRWVLTCHSKLQKKTHKIHAWNNGVNKPKVRCTHQSVSVICNQGSWQWSRPGGGKRQVRNNLWGAFWIWMNVSAQHSLIHAWSQLNCIW